MSLLNDGIMPYPVLPSREAAHQSHEAEKVKICIQRGKATRDQKDDSVIRNEFIGRYR